ncbi:MAG: bifunctional folylpolyglutamate synthase/dihydrofolate synthase [Kiritimatiellae bacterium]|nr:bifunctional folylpolyglutamate synthase/dihydrofolate synthase [Kiritimatiellia bacterium]
MTEFLAELAARRRFGMKPGLRSMRSLCAALGDPQRRLRAIHVAGTNGKGAVCAILDACLLAAGRTTGRYTSPHLLAINERFCLDGAPIDDKPLEAIAERVFRAIRELAPDSRGQTPEITYFEALTAVAFLLFADRRPDWTILECGLGGRLDATNVCEPALCVITRIGLDHCDWLGNTAEAIASEKAGIVKPGVPIVLGRNEPSVRAVVEARAAALGAPFHYAPDDADESEIPADFALAGRFNRENAVTALAALKVLKAPCLSNSLANVTWPGRFQRIGNFIVDGAHNPPAAEALVAALREAGTEDRSLILVAGFCGDKDADCVLRTLAPVVRRAFAVHTGNPRSLSAAETAARMRRVGMDAVPLESVGAAIAAAGNSQTLVCGSLFLAGLALKELNAFPWPSMRRDPAELLRGQGNMPN